MFIVKFAVLLASGDIKMETSRPSNILLESCICDCGCKDSPAPRDWMCSNCSGQIHLEDRVVKGK